MKRIVFALASLIILASCGGGGGTKDLAGLKSELAEKKAALKALMDEIKELEGQIAELDTTVQVEKKVLVTTTTVAAQTFEHFVDIQATVAAEDPGYASSETGGRITKLLVKEGQTVGKGQLIAVIDLETLEKSMDELNKGLELAQQVFERQENLWKQKIGSEVQYLQAKNQVEQLEKRKESLKFQMTKANVYAPIAGTIDRVMVKAGEMAGPGTPIVMIVNLSNLKVTAEIPENYLPAVKAGDAVKVTFPALGDSINTRIIEVGRMINPANRTFEIEIALPNARGLYKPNLVAVVQIRDYVATNAPVVMTELIMQDVEGQDYVYTTESSPEGLRAKKVYVQRGVAYGPSTEIKSGLKGGESILVEGARKASENDLLEVLNDVPGK